VATEGEGSRPVQADEGQPRRRDVGLVRELGFALPPTATVIAVVFLIQGLTNQRLLFASLAGSAFLIYYEPLHYMNTLRVVILAQLIGASTGVVVSIIAGPGYLAAVVAMTGSILILITANLVHPPAVATSLAFAFVPVKERTLLLFVASLIMLASLVVIQRLALWSFRKVMADHA
jgi:CBS-domain-containing membrane protein